VESIDPETFLKAFQLSLLPIIFWLWFWLREDKKNPEPLVLIVISFIAGMVVVPLALSLEKMAIELYTGTNLVVVWVIIEEALKYLAALVVILWHKEVDEPVDYVIYMIVIALGFAALENTLFALNPLSNGDFSTLAITSSFRFLGATLLHVLASATVGMMMAFSFYGTVAKKLLFSTIGLFIAILLHTLFNLFIMESNGEKIMIVFLFVWQGIIILFMLFEKIKLLERSKKSKLHKIRK